MTNQKIRWFETLRAVAAVSLICSSCNRGSQHPLTTEAGPTSRVDTSTSADEINFVKARLREQENATSKPFLSEANLQNADRIVDAINDGKLVPNVEGVVVLPSDYQSLSKDGKVFVTAVNGKEIAILFINWIGKGSNLNGYIFHVGSFDSLGLRKEYDGYLTIEIVTPRPEWPPNDAGKARVQYETTNIVNWYHVMRNED